VASAAKGGGGGGPRGRRWAMHVAEVATATPWEPVATTAVKYGGYRRPTTNSGTTTGTLIVQLLQDLSFVRWLLLVQLLAPDGWRKKWVCGYERPSYGYRYGMSARTADIDPAAIIVPLTDMGTAVAECERQMRLRPRGSPARRAGEPFSGKIDVAGPPGVAHPRRCCRRSIASRMPLTMAANAASRNVTAMMTSTFVQPDRAHQHVAEAALGCEHPAEQRCRSA